MPYTFSPETGRYRGTGGRFVKNAELHAALDQVLDAQAAKMRDLTQSLIDGNLSLANWQRQSMQAIKISHLEGLALANGGWKQLDQAEFGWVGQRVRQQYGYLSQFAQQIADGRQTLGPGALARAEMYAEAGRATHREAVRVKSIGRGMHQEINRLGSAEHCEGCIAESGRGWVPVGTLVPVGSRKCLTRCKCSLAYRKVLQESVA